MRVLVTGGAGVVGKSLTARLVAHGWDVRVIGIEPGIEIVGADYATCDILNFADLRDQMRGCQAVVHLAAIPQPGLAPGHAIFRVNAAGTYNVFEAAAVEGVRRVVQASSINAFGCAWNIVDAAPRYFPIDEAHPRETTDPYSFSKQVVEDIGDYYWRREGISSVALRFPAVWTAERLNSDSYCDWRTRMCGLLDELAAQPEDERHARLADVRQRALDFRGQRLLEYPTGPSIWGNLPDDPLWTAYTFDRFNFWAFVDERDSAQAMEKALLAEFEGSHPLFVNADQNTIGYDSQALVRLFYPDVTTWTRPVNGAESLVSIDRARQLIGFEPEYSHPLP